MILVACGLKREARLVAREGLVAIAGGGDHDRLERDLTAAVGRERPTAILSIGLAGALAPGLRVGDVVVGAMAGGMAGAMADTVSAELVAGLAALLPEARRGTIVGRDVPAATLADKAALHAATGALAVDMESHVAARVAAAHRLAFAAVRAISDDAARTLPPAALVGMKPDGGMALGAVLAALAKAPTQLPALIRTGRDAGQGLAALRRALGALEAGGIGFLDPGKLALDV